MIDEILINVKTGLPPTAAEIARIEQRAMDILANPYASLEQTIWAMKVTDAPLIPYSQRDTDPRRAHRGG